MIAQKISVRTGDGLKTYLQHVRLFCSSLNNVSAFPSLSYNHRRDRFSGLRSVRAFLQTRCWNQLKEKETWFSPVNMLKAS